MSFNTENTPLSTTEAQNNFGSCLKKVQNSSQPLLVQKHGKPVAVLLSYRAWQNLKSRHQKDAWMASCQKLVQSMRKKTKGKQVSSVTLLNELRDERS